MILTGLHGCAQREAMVTMCVLEHRPDLIKIFLDLIAVLGSVIAALSAEIAELRARGDGEAAGA